MKTYRVKISRKGFLHVFELQTRAYIASNKTVLRDSNQGQSGRWSVKVGWIVYHLACLTGDTPPEVSVRLITALDWIIEQCRLED